MAADCGESCDCHESLGVSYSSESEKVGETADNCYTGFNSWAGNGGPQEAWRPLKEL